MDVKFDTATTRFVVQLVQLAFNVGIAIYVWILHKHKANAKKINDLEEKNCEQINSMEIRIVRLETLIKTMPAKKDIGNVHARLDQQNTTLSHMEGELKGIADNMNLILQQMMEKNK